MLKRGLNESGDVANEVEVEQIASDGVRGSLHEGGITSAVQLRGSIPLVWGHGEQSRHMVPRPDIHLQSIDPRYEWTLRHLDDLYHRYDRPIFVFDLIRQVRGSSQAKPSQATATATAKPSQATATAKPKPSQGSH